MAKKKSNAGKFVLGAAVGAALGLLFAPKSGKETRRIIKEKASDLLAKAKEIDVIEVRDEIAEKTSSIVEEIKDLDKEKVLKIAKKKAKDLKKHAEDLVAYTKDKATPVVEKAAEELREKAVNVTKTVLEKLESKEK